MLVADVGPGTKYHFCCGLLPVTTEAQICGQSQADPLFPPLSLLPAVLKLEDDKSPTPPLLQENVFIESSRPKYLENLHSEALEGLKMMQQEGGGILLDAVATCLCTAHTPAPLTVNSL